MSPYRILIVDDEAPMRRYLVRLVDPLQYEVAQAEDGVEALALAGAKPFDLIISDLKMPRMDGLELLARVRAAGMDAAFILLTAYSDLDTALAARERYHISNFLVKPIHNQDQFLFEVDSALRRRDLEVQNARLLDELTAANAEMEQKVRERTQELIDKNRELARLSQFRADVLRVLSHELRTPLAILNGYLHLEGTPRGGEKPRHRAMMESALERVQGIVDKSIRQIRESEFARFDLDLDRVHPLELCQTVVDRINPLLSSRRIQITVRPEPVGPCLWDRARVESIIEELLTNAVRASKGGSPILLSLRKSGDWVEIDVTDSGLGIPRKELARIFEPFVTLGRADRHTSGLFAYRAQGVGLGLSIARILAVMHQGQIIAIPNEAEPGMTFRLRLPGEVRAD